MIPKLARTLAVSACSVVLATLAANATDMRENVAATMLAGAFGHSTETEGPCPAGMTLVTQALTPFCIDKYEASASRECPYPQPKNAAETELNLADPECAVASVPGVVPWRSITQLEAQAVCARSHKRLPTPSEWYKAALGTPDQNGAWQDESCSVARNRADGVAETGGGLRCVSDAGAYDMVGNVWEWVEGTVRDGEWEGASLPQTGFVAGALLDGIAYETASAQDVRFGNDRFWNDPSGVMGIMRGGYFDSAEHAGLFSTYAASPPTFSGEAVGFRCAVTARGYE